MGFSGVTSVDVDIGTVNVTAVLSMAGGSVRISEPIPGTQEVFGSVEVGTVPVIGAFYPGSQKVYGDVEVGTIPVIGAFYPATQPVSGSVGIRSGSVGILGGEIKITDGVTLASVDPRTKALYSIDGEHMKFHEGKRFRTCMGYPAVADNGSAHMLIHVGSIQIHPTLALSSEGMAHGRLFEGANPSYLGTENSVFDMNRSTKNTPEARAYHTLDMGTLGTMIACTLIPGGTGPKSIGGINRLDSAWLLGTFKNYVIQIVNKGGGAKDMQVEFEFLEY